MNVKTINIKHYHDLWSIKWAILQDLKVFDHKKDCVPEFHERLKNYLSRNPKLSISFVIFRDNIFKDLKLKTNVEINQSKIPDNYEFGNPLNRWLFQDSEVMTSEEAKQRDDQISVKLENEISAFNDFLKSIKDIGGDQIIIIDK